VRNYRKSEPPAWHRHIVLFLTALFFATLLLFVVWGYILWLETDEADDCQERGGEWNYETRECEGARWE
jgi:hypothetical protein